MQDPQGYLRFLRSLGYSLSVISEEKGIVDCGHDVGEVMDEYHAAGVDHIDILALQPGH